jgi:hypothetical protein
VANFLTRTPTAPPPVLPPGLQPLVRLADTYFSLLLSRPASGSLNATWVTPATLILVVATLLLGLPAAFFFVDMGNPVAIGFGLLLIFLAPGALSIALVGLAQRFVQPPTPLP